MFSDGYLYWYLVQKIDLQPLKISIDLTEFKSYKVCSHRSGMKLEISIRRKLETSTSIWKVNDTFLNK